MSMFQDFLKSNLIYKPSEILAVLEMCAEDLQLITAYKKGKYYNVPCSFDIETTSTTINGEKVGLMYEWTLGIDGLVIIGRTWQEYKECIRYICDTLELNGKRKLVIYVHNLAFEFQFLRKHFSWEKVFAISRRTPIYAVTSDGIEYRCSYLLSGYSLETLANNISEYHLKKLVGDLDYTQVRTHITPLTAAEIAYCVNDVKIVMAYIDKCIHESGNIAKIPYTKTGYVRKYCRENCFYNKGEKRNSAKFWRYQHLMSRLTLDVDEYRQLKRAFQGGFTHANAWYSGEIVDDVTSYDFTSSYPAVMVCEKFPMSKAENIEIKSKEDLEHNLKYYCCIFDVEFENIESRLHHENYISKSRCIDISRATINNGRVYRADRLLTTVTEIDYMLISHYYTWDSMRIGNFKRYRKDYLPLDFVKSILKLYVDKTELKGVAEKEKEYMVSKGMLNSCYGMCVTDIVRDEITYDDIEEWQEYAPDISEQIQKYNTSKSRFLFYPWGVWVTAYARRNLFTGITEFADDYIYSDTDSIKVIHADDTHHKEYINIYNDVISKKMKIACDAQEIDFALTHPKTIKGIEKPLGVWDFDGHYKRFKTLGSKRYMVETDNGDISITVSGLNKKVALPYLLEKGKDNVFNEFSDSLYVADSATGKLTHTYIDDEITAYVTDYLGQTVQVTEKSSVHLAPSDYTLSLSAEYADFITNVVLKGVIK